MIDNAALVAGKIRYTAVGLVLEDDLTYDEWLDVGRRLYDDYRALHWRIGDWLNHGETHYGETYTQALAETRFEYDTLAHDKWVCSRIEIWRRRQNLTFAHHREVADLAPHEQDVWLEAAEERGLTSKELRQVLKSALPPAPTPAPPPGTYSVIYADPPWRYDFAETENRAVENQYPTMPVEDICALPVQANAAPDCILFLWATSPKLPEAMAVLDAWGFQYRTCMVWVKDKIGMGYYARQQHELLLIGKRGEPPVPSPSDRPASVLMAPRSEHSAKPPEFYGLIERMYPNGRYLELFARNAREGWHAWGNQAPAVDGEVGRDDDSSRLRGGIRVECSG